MDTPSDPSKPRVTLKDIARQAGISHGAVSLALRNSHEVSKETCERIQRIAHEMGYQPNPLAAGLAQFKRDSRSIPIQAALGWLNFWSDPKTLRGYSEFEHHWQGATDAAEKHGYHLEEFCCMNLMPVSRLEKILLARGINGLLVPPGRVPPEMADFPWDKFSVVRLSRPEQELRFHAVMSDQLANAMLAFEKTREKGYQRIGYIGRLYGPRLYTPGYLWAQSFVPEELRLPPLFLADGKDEENQCAFTAWVEENKPDAIITEWAQLTPMLQKVGLRVPEDVGVAALNIFDMPFGAGINPNPDEIGRVGVLAAISFINDQARGIPTIQREVLVKGDWVDGASLPGM